MEKIICNRLMWLVESNCIFPDSQFGFRCGRSCVDSIVGLTSFVHASFAAGKVVVRAFIDIRRAFDNVIPAILMRDLVELGVPAQVRKFIHNLIIEREAYFIINGALKSLYYIHKYSPGYSTGLSAQPPFI